MTATDTLRTMLSERGVEYEDRDMFGKHVFHWGEPLHGAMFTDSGEWTELVVENASPEQAVEATLGRGTCRNLIAHIQGQMPMLHCEECGCTTTLNVPSGGAGYIGETAMDWPLYCANCGRKVES